MQSVWNTVGSLTADPRVVGSIPGESGNAIHLLIFLQQCGPFNLQEAVESKTSMYIKVISYICYAL